MNSDIVEKYKHLVLMIAAKYRRSRMEFDDIVQEGWRGLLIALKRHDGRNDPTMSYERLWIRQSIQWALRKQDFTFFSPDKRNKNYRRLREVTVHIDQALINTLHSQAKSAYEICLANEMKERVQQALASLPEMERRIIELRYEGNGKPLLSYAQIAKQLKMSKDGVRKMELRALARLRKPEIRKKLRGLL